MTCDKGAHANINATEIIDLSENKNARRSARFV